MRRLLRTIRLFFFSADTPMLPFIAQRIVKAVVVLLAIVILNFFLIRAAPGDPAVVMAGEAGASDPLFIAQLREKFGRSEERRVGKGWVSTCRSRWSPYH